MKRYTIFLACLMLALSVMVPGNAAAEFYCDECHGYYGAVNSLNYKAKTVIEGEVVSLSGTKSNESLMEAGTSGLGAPVRTGGGGGSANSYLMNIMSYGNQDMMIMDWCYIMYGDAFIWMSNSPDSPVGGALFGSMKKGVGNVQMSGYITTSGYVEGYPDYFDMFGMPEFYFYGTGTILMFRGSAETIVNVKQNVENETARALFRYMVAEAVLVDVYDGVVQWDTARPASAEISSTPGKYYLEYLGDAGD